MFKNYFKVAVRTLTKNKMFSFINIFGLALSMSVCLIVLIRIKDQVGYDQFHPHPSRTYRIITDISNKEGNQFHFATSPLPFMKDLTGKYDIVESATQLYLPGNQDASTAKKKLAVNKIFTDPSFFKVFGFTLSSGDAATALSLPNSVVLSREAALRFFGTTNVSGQTLAFKDWGDFRVTGVLDPPKGKSHIDYEALLSMSSVPVLEKEEKLKPFLDSWNNFTTSYTYLTVRNGITERQLHAAVTATSADIIKNSKMVGKESFSFKEQPFKDIILGDELNFSIGNVGSRGKVWAEAGIAFIILLSACFNYTNLSIARSFNRGKEVGIRKVSGAFRSHVFMQFILESVLVCLLALGLAYVFLQLIIDHAPFASELMPDHFTFDPTLFAWFLGFSLFTGLLAGILPAWALSAFKPVQVLKNLTTVKLFGGNGFRKTLIVVQFTLSLVLIMFTQIFNKQFTYMANADAGFSQQNLVSLSLQGADPKLLKEELSRLSGVERISISSADLGKNSATETRIKAEPTAEPIGVYQYDIDDEFIPNMQLKLIAGENFPVAREGGTESRVIVNEQILQLLKIRSADAAIGKTVWLDDSIPVSIAGVMKDFYFQGVGVPLRPLLFRNRPSDFNVLTIRTRTGDKRIMAGIEAIWKKYEPAVPINYNWLQNDEGAQSIGSVSMLDFLAFITAVLACMGL
ncbi:MAG TPA: ABC transporter permease, partial [Chitinophagaceae bacterium]|nr:ABC transporter permease [Chitinophagaceae bacterium]